MLPVFRCPLVMQSTNTNGIEKVPVPRLTSRAGGLKKQFRKRPSEASVLNLGTQRASASIVTFLGRALGSRRYLPPMLGRLVCRDASFVDAANTPLGLRYAYF